MSDRTRYYRFGPHVIEIARFILDVEFAPLETVPFFQEIDRRWPGLSFRDFLGAAVLAEALALQPQGRA